MHTLLRPTLVAVLLLLASPSLAAAGEVVLANGDVLTGRVWKQDRTLHVEHPVLGAIQLSPAHYTKATLDEPERILDALTGRPAAARLLLCDPPKTLPSTIQRPCKSPWEFAVGLGLSLDGGNTTKQQYNFDFHTAYEWNRINRLSFRTVNFYEYARGVQTEGRYDASLRYQRNVSARGYLFALWQAHRDDFADIQLRQGWAVGYGHRFIQRKKEVLQAEIGAGSGTENRDGTPSFATALMYAGAKYKKTFRTKDWFEARAWTVPYFDNVELSPSRLELRYGHPLRRHLDMTATFLLDYVPEPPPGIDPYDVKLIFGLRWRPLAED